MFHRKLTLAVKIKRFTSLLFTLLALFILSSRNAFCIEVEKLLKCEDGALKEVLIEKERLLFCEKLIGERVVDGQWFQLDHDHRVTAKGEFKGGKPSGLWEFFPKDTPITFSLKFNPKREHLCDNVGKLPEQVDRKVFQELIQKDTGSVLKILRMMYLQHVQRFFYWKQNKILKEIVAENTRKLEFNDALAWLANAGFKFDFQSECTSWGNSEGSLVGAALINQNEKAIELLIKNSAKIDNFCLSEITMAVSLNNIAATQLLISNGANPCRKGENNKNATDLAKDKG
jgi:hypothetical protein